MPHAQAARHGSTNLVPFVDGQDVDQSHDVSFVLFQSPFGVELGRDGLAGATSRQVEPEERPELLVLPVEEEELPGGILVQHVVERHHAALSHGCQGRGLDAGEALLLRPLLLHLGADEQVRLQPRVVLVLLG